MMSNLQRLFARLQTLKPNRISIVVMVTGPTAQPVAWSVFELGKAEGLGLHSEPNGDSVSVNVGPVSSLTSETRLINN